MQGHILIVEDNELNLKLAETLLTLDGFRVTGAHDADEATAAVTHELPDLVLLDIQLPGVDGLELARRWRADDRTRGLPIVALTAYTMKGDEERFRAAGCDGYIAKPIDQARFSTQVQDFLTAGHHEGERAAR